MDKFKIYFEILFLKIISTIFRKTKQNNLILLNSNSNILLLITGNKSEALLKTPLIRLIKRSTNANIQILANEGNYSIFNNNPDIQKIHLSKKTLINIINHVRQLNKNYYDVIINCNEKYNLFEILYATLIRSNFKLGFKNIQDKIFTHLIEKPNPNSHHFVDRILQLSEKFNFSIDKSNLNLTYFPNSDAEEIIDKFLISVFDTNKMIVLINISSEINKNYWDVDNYKRLLKYIKNYDVNIIITSSEKDILIADKISLGKEKIYFSDDLDKFAALVSKSNFIFTPNSFILQLSAVFKKPVFCLFTKEDNNELLRVPYTSDFDFISSETNDFSDLHFGKVLNSFIPYFDYVYESFKKNIKF